MKKHHIQTRVTVPMKAQLSLVNLLQLMMAALVVSCLSGHALAKEYTAKRSGDWSSANTWRPRGVPGIGDSVVSLGKYTVVVSGEVAIGTSDAQPQVALVLDGAGTLSLANNAQLTLSGHLLMTGNGARIRLEPAARLLFAAEENTSLQLQMVGSKQRLEFAGIAGSRAEVALAPEAKGHWFVASEGHRDSMLAGAYGRISDALNPEDGKAWSMYLANNRVDSRLVARKIEFVNCGQIGVFGLDAGEFTTVDINGWTFRDSHPAADGVPAFWFDGYGDIVVEAPASKVPKQIRNLTSDKEIYARYLQNYRLDNWVLGASGQAGSVRTGNNGGNALMQRDLFQVVRDSGGVGLVADTTENVYMYAEADNPHGFDTRHLRGDALLRNFWFESHFPNQSDTGDAVLTNGPQSWVAEHGGDPVTLTIEHSGSIGDTSENPRNPVFLTLNESTGMRFRLRNNLIRQPRRFNSIALDENGETPTGTGLEFARNLIFSEQPVEGYALGSAAGKTVVQSDAFRGIERNLYFNLTPRLGGYPKGVHAMRSSETIDQGSVFVDPQLRDPTRNLAQWDLIHGGPGTAEHAISELLKLNDDEGFDPAYQVGALIAFVRAGFLPTNPALLDDQGRPLVGPALTTDPRSP